MIQLNCLVFTYYTIIIFNCSSILYYLYSIVYLIEDYNIANDCKSSHMWEYVLFNLLSSINTILINKNSNYVGDNNKRMECNFIYIFRCNEFMYDIMGWNRIMGYIYVVNYLEVIYGKYH